MKDRIHAVVVEPMKVPEIRDIGAELHDLQDLVGGYIQAVYPYEDPVAIICNEEGKLMGLPLNRALRDEDGDIYDVVAGTFAIVGLGEEDFDSLTDELAEKYAGKFKTPEQFIHHGSAIAVIPLEESRPGNDMNMTM